MGKCADIRGELGKVYLLYLKSKVNRDTIEVVSKNVKDLTQGLVNKYQDGLTPQILSEFYNSVEEIFKKYNNSNKINSDFLKGIQVPVEVKTEIEQVIDQGTYMDFRFKNSNNSDSDASKDVDLKKVNSEEDLLDIFNGSNEMYGAFIRRFNTDILNMVLFGYNSEGKSSFNNSIEQLNKNISQWSHEITDEFNEKFDKDFSKIDSNIASSKLIDVTDDGKDSLYRKFVSRHFDKLINLTDNKIIRKNNKSNTYEPKISSSIRTGWTNNEFISAFDELGDFIKEVVESRKIIDINGNETGQTLSWSQIFMSLGKLQGYVDRTENYYLDNLISDIVNSKKNGKNTGKIVRESKIFNDITIDELNTLNSLYVHFFNKDPNGFTSKNGNSYSSFYNRSLNSYKDSDSRNSNIIDYYDLVKYNFEKQSTNKYSQVVYDYDKKTFVQEDLNTIRTNKQRSLYVNGLNMYKDLFDYDALPDKIKEISDKFELIKTNNNGINGYSLKYKNVEIFNTNALNSFDLSILSTEDDYNNMSKLIDYIITVNPTIVPTDFIKYILQTTSTKKENDFDKINNAYRKVLLPITNRMLSIIGNDKMNFFSESDTQDSSGYKYALTEYAKWLDVISGDNIKAVTKTANDTFVPSFGQINMVKEPRTLISFLKKTLRKSKQKNSPVSANIFMKGQNDKALKEPVTDTFIYFKGEAIPIAKAGSTELFINHFMIKYLFNIANNDYNIQVQPTTYSDKSKQTSAVIDSKSVIDYSSQNQQSIADKDVTEMKSMLLDNMEESYSAIINHVIGTLNMSLGTKKTSLNSIQDYIIEKKLKVSDIIKLADSKGLYIFSTMFFEGEKINSLLMQIDKQPSILKKMVEDDLKNSIEMLNSENIFIDYKMFKPTIDLVLNGQYGEKFKTTDSSFEENWVDPSTGRIIMEKDGKINPLYERYFYEKNIYSENYRTLLAGNLAMHPAKGGAKSFTENVSKRYVAQTKRTVGMQGTIHPYRLGMYNGLPYYEKIAFVKDPKMALFNQLGNNHDQEVTDGSSFSLFLSTILKNNSLLDQGGQIHHKSLGMMIEPNSGSFMLMKHADHSMTNERLRNSKYAEFNLNNIVRKMMNQPLGYNIDLTKDFNGKPIYKSRSASYRYDGSLYTILDIIKDEKSGPNNYKFIVEETDGNTTNKEEYSVPINSLYDLWSMLGGENSITMDYSTGKYKYDNSSWYNLADFINKVGFYKNEKNLKSFMDKNEIKDYKKFRQDITSNRYDDDSSVEYLEERPSADSVYQPLKDKFISQITFTTSQKVGAVNPNSVSVLSDDTPFMTFDHYSSVYTGLQLDHEHHTDDSDITEPTQILSAILFDGDASQYNRQLKMGIKLSIIHNISKYLKTNPNLKSIDMYKLRQTISSNFLNELKKKDLSNFASSVCMNIQNSINKILNEANIKLNNGDVDGYNRLNNEANSISTQVPFSDPGLYNAFINIMNSTFTSLAIRRKLEGSMNILSPQNYFITVHEKDGKVMIGEEFDGEISYTPIDKTNVRMFDKIRVTSVDGLSDEFDLKDYNSFQQFRNFTGDFVVEKINGAGRRLLPHRIMFSFDGQNKIDYYSLDSSNLINYFNYIKSLEKGSDLYNLKTQEYLYIVKKAVSDFDLKHPLINSIIEKIKSGLTKDSELSNQEFNILKNLQSMYYKKLKEDGMANNPVYNIISNINSIPEDIKNLYLNQNYEQFFNELLKLDVSTPIQNYTEEPAEVMMPANLGKSFMIEEGDNINEIDENVLYNRLIQKYNTFSIENIGVRSENTVLEYSGNNLYVLSEQDINKIKTDPKLSKFITPSYKYNGENDDKYIIDQKTGEQILNVKSLQFYEYRMGKNTYRLVSYRNPNDIKLLNGFDDGKGNAYSIVLDNENYNNELQVYSKRLYNNFKASLIGAMCRIPSQAKQSGMPFKVVGFIKTENNVAFVPAENLWLTGGDYDIDKIVQALLSFHKNGMIKKFNPYFLENDSEFIIESLNLPVPDMVLRTISQSNTNKSSYNITANDLELLNKLYISSKKEDTSSITLDEFKRITHVLNDIVNADNDIISISPTEQVNPESLKNVNEFLQDMFIGGYSLLEDPSVLENVIVGAMIHAYNDGRNALHTYAPMDSDTIKDIAKESSKGAIMAKFSPTNPVTDVLMQITNMVGKDGIAIAATGQKVLSIIIDRYLKIKSGNFKNIAFESNLASLVSEITGEGEEETTRIINGFDLKGIGQNLVEFFRQNFSDDLFKTEDPSGQLSNKEYWIKNKIESLFDESNNSLNVSELITLATDGSKKPILILL